MIEANSFLQIFTVVSIIGIFISFIVRVSIQALILRYFTKKYELPHAYDKAWLAILVPSLVVIFLAFPLALIDLPNFLLIVLWLLFLPALILSVKFAYKTKARVSTAISLKFFLVIFAIAVMIFVSTSCCNKSKIGE